MAPYFVNSIEVTQNTSARPPWDRPKEPARVELPVGFRKTPESRPLTCDIIFERDQFLSLRDGLRLRADIYRPKTEAEVPAIMMWSPYGKSGTGEGPISGLDTRERWLRISLSGEFNLDKVPLRAGVPLSKLSGYESFEGYVDDGSRFHAVTL